MTRAFEDPKSPRGARRYPAVRCARCNGERWPYGGIAPPAPFVCQRCRLVLSGARCVVDPAAPERRAAWKASGIVLPPSDRNPSEEAVHARTCRGIAGRSTDPSPDPHKQRGSGGRFLSPGDLPKNSRRAGGRPMKHSSDRVARAAAQRAYRARRKTAAIAANDAALAAIDVPRRSQADAA
jgi:hypothetical protein